MDALQEHAHTLFNLAPRFLPAHLRIALQRPRSNVGVPLSHFFEPILFGNFNTSAQNPPGYWRAHGGDNL